MKKFSNFSKNIISKNEMRFINGGNTDCLATFRNSSGNEMLSESMGGNCDGWSNCAPNGADMEQSACVCV